MLTIVHSLAINGLDDYLIKIPFPPYLDKGFLICLKRWAKVF